MNKLHLVVSLTLPLLVLTQDVGTEHFSARDIGQTDHSQNPSDAGAAGAAKRAINLSTGALAAIIVVAVLFVIISIASTTLWWLAKKRQWQIRQSIRRFTSRASPNPHPKQSRLHKRAAIRLASPPPPKHARQDRDLEKGIPPAGVTTTVIAA